MPEEGAAIVKKLNMSPLEDDFDPYLPVDWFISIQPGVKIYLAETRKSQKVDVAQVGPETASFVAWECMQAIDPDLVINVGVAGALGGSGAKVGDIYQCEQAYYHHRVFSTAAYNRYGSGGFDCVTVDGDDSLKTAKVSTSSSFVMSERDKDIMGEQGAILKDMEAAAVASVCYVREKDIFILKGVSDILESDEIISNEVMDNIQKVMEKVAEKLDFIIHKFFLPKVEKREKHRKILIPKIFKKHDRSKKRPRS